MKGLINNERDRANLDFLIKSDRETVSDRLRQADADDLDYYQELLAAFDRELDLWREDLVVEAKLELMPTYNEAAGLLDTIAKRFGVEE